MTARRWLALAAILAALVGLQAFGLDRQPEKRAEDAYTRLADVPPSEMVPSYIASLFFGAFRALVVDVLWIQLRRAEQERRWYEARQILELIAHFQPRNPEVASHLGWHAAYNIANGFSDRERQWEWVDYGLGWLRKGNRRLPRSPHLKFELAFTLLHKPAWKDGRFEEWILERLEADDRLQRDLLPGDGPWDGRRRSAFELAVPWLERSRDEILALEKRRYLTHLGLYLYPSTMDGYLGRAHYFHGMWERRRGRYERAKQAFERAHEHVEEMLQKTYFEDLGLGIFEDRDRFLAGLPPIMDLERKALESGRPEDERALLVALQALIADSGPVDEGHLWFAGNPEAPLNRLKQKLAGGKDTQEFNDTIETATLLAAGDFALANLEPDGADVDWYRISAPSPGKDAPPTPPRPIRVTIRLNDGITPPPVELRLSIIDFGRTPVREAAARGRQTVEFETPRYNDFFVRVERAGPAPPGPDATRYSFQYSLER
jgi:hypothetical protein